MDLRQQRKRELERIRKKRRDKVGQADKEARLIALAEKLHVKIGGGHGRY